jgi:hypothetical protein
MPALCGKGKEMRIDLRNIWKSGPLEPWTVGRRTFCESLPEYAAAIVLGRALEVLRACGVESARDIKMWEQYYNALRAFRVLRRATT